MSQENNNINLENMNIENNAQYKNNLEYENNKIYVENLNKEKKSKNTNSKKIFFKFFASMCGITFLGVGIGAGTIIAKNVVIKYEKDNFKFDINNQEILNEQISLTSNNIANVFEKVGDSVVNISTLTAGRYMISGAGSGSGIIYKVEGDTVYIITNNHVIENASTITISITGEEQVTANLIGADPSSDLAIISTSKKELEQAGIKEIKVAKFADSDQVKVGEFVFPIGNALGRGKTITQGIISAQNKQINIDGKKLTVLQTDAAINPGNSGGALINSNGEVVGINTAKLSSSAIEGIGYAIPTNIALKVAEDIIQNGSVQKPYFGVYGETITDEIKTIFNLKTGGVLITYVEERSAAAKAGIIPTDIITSFNGQKVETLEQLSEAIKATKVNTSVDVEIVRNGQQQMTLKVVLVPNSKNM